MICPHTIVLKIYILRFLPYLLYASFSPVKTERSILYINVAASMDAEVAADARKWFYRVLLFVNAVDSARSDMAH